MNDKMFCDFLGENPTCTVATSANNVPRSTTVDYVMVDDNLIFSSAADTEKARNIANNNRISITVNDASRARASNLNGSTITPTAAEIAAYNEVYCKRYNIPTCDMPVRNYYKLVPEVTIFNDYSKCWSASGMAADDYQRVLPDQTSCMAYGQCWSGPSMVADGYREVVTEGAYCDPRSRTWSASHMVSDGYGRR